MCLVWLVRVAFVLACSSWGLLAEWVVWLLAKGGLLLSGRLPVTAILRVLAALGALLRHGLCAWEGRRETRRGNWVWCRREALGFLCGREAFGGRLCGCRCRWQRSPRVGNWGVLGRLGTCLWLLTFDINIFLACTSQAESAKLNRCAVNLTVAWHTDSFFLVEHATLVAYNAWCRASSLQSRSRKATGCWACSSGLSLETRVWCSACGSAAGIP